MSVNTTKNSELCYNRVTLKVTVISTVNDLSVAKVKAEIIEMRTYIFTKMFLRFYRCFIANDA